MHLPNTQCICIRLCPDAISVCHTVFTRDWLVQIKAKFKVSSYINKINKQNALITQLSVIHGTKVGAGYNRSVAAAMACS